MADAPSSRLKDFLNSTVLVTLITVVIGGIGGNYILQGYQDRSKQQERELDDHKDLLKRQEEVAINAFQLLGDAQYFGIALNKLAKWAPSPFSTPAQLETQKKSNELIWSRSVDFLERWEKEKTSTGMRLLYFYDDSVSTAWTQVKDAGDEMLSSALNRVQMRVANPTAPVPQTPPGARPPEEQKFDEAVNELARALERARRASMK
jgi:hypothetical protein